MPERVPGSTGVVAVALPTREPDGQAAGLASKVAATHASLNVAWREGNCLGSEVTIFLMLPWPAPWLILTSRLAPLVREVFAPVKAVRLGLNGSAPHSPTENGVETFWVAVALEPSRVRPVSVDSVASWLQLVGLSR